MTETATDSISIAGYSLKKNYLAAAAIFIFHAVGIAGFNIEDTTELMKLLVPFHLLLMFGILWFSQAEKSNGFLLTILGIGLAGYAFEVLGVHTYFPFGRYEYQTTLGFKVFQVPPVLIINWISVIYASYSVACYLTQSKWLSVLFSATFATLLDFLIEPIAIKFQFWHWFNNPIPVNNFISWFVLSFIFSLFLTPYRKELNIFIGLSLYMCEVQFFGILILV